MAAAERNLDVALIGAAPDTRGGKHAAESRWPSTSSVESDLDSFWASQ